MKYTIVKDYIHQTEKRVNKLIEKGWKPLGGVSITQHGYATYYVQAMIKEDNEDS